MVFDLRAIGFDVHSVDAAPGTTFGQALSQIGAQLLPSQIWSSCSDGSLEVFSNGARASLSHLTLPPVDVVELKPSAETPHIRGSSQPTLALLPAANTGGSVDVSSVSELVTIDSFPSGDQGTGVSQATSLPIARRRPPTPPIPVTNRWGRSRATPPVADPASIIDTEVLGSEASQCTIFDPVRQVEVVTSFSCASADALLRFAIQRAKHLGDVVEGRILTVTVDGYPTPQVCIHSPINVRYVMLPVALPNGVCTIPVLRSASPFELALQMEQTCSMPRLYRHLIARQLSFIRVNRQPKDPFLPDAPIVLA